MKELKNYCLIVVFLMLNGCAAPIAIGIGLGAAVTGAVTAINLTQDQYPDIDFDKTAPRTIVYQEDYTLTWQRVVDTLGDTNEQSTELNKTFGNIRTAKKNLYDVSWVEKGLGKATFRYEYHIAVKETVKGTEVKVLVPFWEENVYIPSRKKKIPEGSNMMRHIFFRNLNLRLTANYKKFPTSSDHDDQPPQKAEPVYQPPPAQKPDSEPIIQTSPSSAVNKDDNQSNIERQKIKQVQQSLKIIGYDTGPVDGVMGPKTRKSIERFQHDNNLPATGIIEQETINRLKNAKEQFLAENDKNKPFVQEEINENTNKGTNKNTETKPQTNEPVLTQSKSPENEKQVVIAKATTSETTEMKASADPFAETIRSIPKNTTIEILDKTHDWYKVRFKGKEGYVYSDFVKEY